MAAYLFIVGLQAIGLLVLRVVFGGLMFAHGYPKVGKRRARVMDAMRSRGIPGPVTLITGYFEIVGGLLLVFGIGVQVVGLLLALKSAATIYVSRNLFGRGFDHGYEVEIAWVVVGLALFMLGAGTISVDNYLIPHL
ncbi:MAG: DoxX family protein [Methanomassiliicoccales archaeon]